MVEYGKATFDTQKEAQEALDYLCVKLGVPNKSWVKEAANGKWAYYAAYGKEALEK